MLTPAEHARLQEQLRFYFSDANLRRDGFLRQQIDAAHDRYVPVDLFLRFNRVVEITADVAEIRRAMQATDSLEVSKDGLKVRRKNPTISNKDVDAATVYVENLPADATHESIAAAMKPYGKVEYISLPRYAVTADGYEAGQHKGFAFVEFSSRREAQACCAAFAAAAKAVEASAAEEPGEVQNDGATSTAQSANLLRVLMKSEWEERKRQYKTLQKRFAVETKQRRREQHSANDEAKKTAPAPAAAAATASEAAKVFDPAQIVRGVVLAVSSIPPTANKGVLKDYIAACCGFSPAYIDIVPGHSEGYVRMAQPHHATLLLANPTLPESVSASAAVASCRGVQFAKLTGEPETAYWRKIHDDKYNRQGKKKAKKGRDRIQEMQRHDPEHGVPVGKPLGAALAPEKGTRKVKKGTVTRFDDDEEEDGKTADAKPAADAGADSAQPAKKAKREEEASSAKEADKAEPATADEADTGAPPSKRRKRKAGKA